MRLLLITAIAFLIVELTATHGEHIAQWRVDGQPWHAVFRVDAGSAPAAIAVAEP